jgi:multicomponent Na+:H+ antiporter subunit E
MSPALKTKRDGTVRPARYRALQWPVLIGLTFVWTLLWGSYSPLAILGGFLVAVIGSLAFPLPPLRLDVTVRPWALMVLLAKFAWDIVVSSIQVAIAVIRPNRYLTNAVVEVNLKTPSDIVMTIVAEMTCLIPGSIVIEARRSTHTLYLHVLNVKDEAGAERFRQSVLAQEERLVRALGKHVEHLDDAPSQETSGGNA